MKVAYMKELHPTKGTCYRQRITVTADEYDLINKRMAERYRKTQNNIEKSHIMDGTQLHTITYGKPLDFADRDGNKAYLTLTQLYMVAAAVYGLPEFEKAHKRITDNNTILMVNG